MPATNCNNPSQTCGSEIYKPPHLRPGYTDTVNNNSTKYADKNPKVKHGKVTNFGNGQTLKNNNLSSFGNGQTLKNNNLSSFGNGQTLKNNNLPNFGNGQTLKNNNLPSLGNGQSIKNNNFSGIINKQSPKHTKVTQLGNGESFSKSYVPPKRRNYVNFGISTYFDCKFKGSHMEYKKKLEESTTVYVGNLNDISTESDVHRLFSKAGAIKTIVMGIDKKTLEPGGFCFVEFENRSSAEHCVNQLQDILLDGNNLVIDWDAGFAEGRQYRRVRRPQNQRSRVIYPSSPKVNCPNQELSDEER